MNVPQSEKLWELIDRYAEMVKNGDPPALLACAAAAVDAHLDEVDATSWTGRLQAFRRIENKESVCEECEGSGKALYPTMSTWRYDVGAPLQTWDVCDICWGSGDENAPGEDLRTLHDWHACAKDALASIQNCCRMALREGSDKTEMLREIEHIAKGAWEDE